MNTPLPLTPADATRHDVLAELNALLEAERAGARVAMETAREIREPELAALVKDIHKDEVRWCGMLMGTIQSLGATPSSATGAFWGKAMAIADVPQRLAFLNRGQAWVVRKLQALIPRIDDAAARADLERMLEAHHQNIRRVEASSQVAPPPPNTAPGAAPLPTEPAALIEHILARYHEVHRQQLPELVRLAARVEAVHGEHPAVPRGLAALLQQVQAELLEHMQKEETILFPMLARGGHPMAVHPIGVMRAEHEAHAQRLAQVLALTHDATPPDGACATWRQLSTALRQFADDLQRHIGIENDQLFARFDTPGRG